MVGWYSKSIVFDQIVNWTRLNNWLILWWLWTYLTSWSYCCTRTLPRSLQKIKNLILLDKDVTKVVGVSSYCIADITAGPFRRDVLSQTKMQTHNRAFKSVINCKCKSNFRWYLFTAQLPVFGQDICLLSCYYYTDGCH